MLGCGVVMNETTLASAHGNIGGKGLFAMAALSKLGDPHPRSLAVRWQMQTYC